MVPKKKSVAEVLTDMKLAYQRSKKQTKPVLEDKQVKEVEISQERRQPLPSPVRALEPAREKRKASQCAAADAKPVAKQKAAAVKSKSKKLPAKEKQQRKTKQAAKPTNGKPLKMDRKNVASRAYHAMLSKMEKTMSKELAKIHARKAHADALEQWNREHKDASSVQA